MFNNYYNRKRVLVTGHTGFKGSWLSLWLVHLGAEVAGFSAYLPSNPCNFEVLGLKNLLRHIQGDVRDFDHLIRVFHDFRPDMVFHLAAQPLVRRSYDDPKLTFDTNLGGTVNVLECIRKSESVEGAVIITSDKCYKNKEWVWGYRENDQLGGNDPYSASKGCAEIAINSYCQSFFTQGWPRVASTRAGNVIGGGDWAEDRIIPDCIRAWSEGKEAIIRSPQATRPWQHVAEPLSGYLCLGSKLGNGNPVLHGEAFNFGPKSDVIQPVRVLISSLKKCWGEAQWKVKEDKLSNKKESGLLKLCCDKALSLLNWKAVLSFEETMEFTASWYKKFYQYKGNMREISTQQIAHYHNLADERGMDWVE